MKRHGSGTGSERSLLLRRSKVASGETRASPASGSRDAQEDPRKGGGGQARRVPSTRAGVRHSGDKKISPVLMLPSPDSPATLVPSNETPTTPSESEDLLPELSHYKGVSLKNVGRDARGRVITHKRSEKLAKQIAVWVAGGADVNAIAIRVNIRPGLLKQEYEREISLGTENVHMDVHEHLLKRVKKSDRIAIFYAKAKMGYRDGESAQANASFLAIHIHE